MGEKVSTEIKCVLFFIYVWRQSYFFNAFDIKNILHKFLFTRVFIAFIHKCYLQIADYLISSDWTILTSNFSQSVLPPLRMKGWSISIL